MNLKAKDEISLSLYREREYKAGQQGNVCRSGILSLENLIRPGNVGKTFSNLFLHVSKSQYFFPIRVLIVLIY